MSHLSSILERDAAVTDLARSKCSFSNSVPLKKKWKSNSAGSEGFNFNHVPFALSRDCSQRKSCFEASLLHVSESISPCSEIHNTKRIHYPPAFKDTLPYPTHTHWSSLLHTQDSVHHLPSISSHQVTPSFSWFVSDPIWLSTAPQSRDKAHPQAQGIASNRLFIIPSYTGKIGVLQQFILVKICKIMQNIWKVENAVSDDNNPPPRLWL